MIKILVTGLCLSRNLGGPAMGLTLVEQLQKKYDDCIDFKFAVTPAAFDEETYWVNHYGLKVVRRDNAFVYFVDNNPLALVLKIGWKSLKILRGDGTFSDFFKANKPLDIKEVHNDFMEAYEWADLIIDMSGISYVGDGVLGPFEGLTGYGNFYYAQRAGKPFARFIQSFGPFGGWKVKYFAKKEFDKLPFVPSRGSHSAAYCRAIVQNPEKVYAFPDVAILLPENEEWADEFLLSNNLTRDQYVIVSPSSVIHRSVSKSVGGSVGEKHIESMIKICNGLIARGEYVVFLPHMYSKNLDECDREVSRSVAKALPMGSYLIVEEDIDPMMAKGLISYSKYAIVSRYHALVAALSTGVDVITVGWNIKYQDIMEYYGKEKYAVDIRDYQPDILAERVFSLIDDFVEDTRHHRQKLYIRSQQNAVVLVNNAFDLLTEWMDSQISLTKKL